MGRSDGAVLVTGYGGSGKSTAALACRSAGMPILGDDYVAIRPPRWTGDYPTVHNVFASLKVMPQEIGEAGGRRLVSDKRIIYPFSTSIEGLFAVTGGVCDYAAISALSRPELARIIQGFRDSFDHIVIDAGPVLDVSDPLLLGQQSDAVILSTMLDVSRVPQVVAAVERLRSVGGRVLGVIVHGGNAAPSRRRSALPLAA